jgi:hypothetical protein
VISPLFAAAVLLVGLGILGTAVVAPLAAAWWARSSAPGWSAATAVSAAVLAAAIVLDRTTTLAGDAGEAAPVALAVAAALLAVAPIATSSAAVAGARRAGREFPTPLLVTYLLALGVFCLGLAAYVAGVVHVLATGPEMGPFENTVQVLAAWIAGVLLVAVLTGTVVVAAGALGSRHREVSP